MPVKIQLGRDSEFEGIAVEYTKSSQIISIWGWYDSFVGIQGDALPLAEFLAKLGITEKDVTKAFKKASKPE